MSNILSIGVSGLLTNRQGMDTAGHNIANVNTEGYSRQRVEFSTREPNLSGGHFVGSGVEAAQITRSYDKFLASQVRSSQSVTSELDAYFSGAQQLDELVADPDVGLQPAVQNFFNSIQGVADDPTSTAARQVMLSEMQSLVDRFHYIDGEFERSLEYTNDQIDNTVRDINGIATNIAAINEKIVQAFGATANSIPNDLLDQRDQLIDDLSKLVDIQVLEQRDGAMNVFIGKGQALVLANDTATLRALPSDLDSSRLDVVLSFPSGTQTITDQLSGGQLGGLIRYREEILDPARNQLGLVALGLAADLNEQHRLGLDLDGLAGSSLFSTGFVEVLEPGANGSSITVDYDSIGNLTGSDYKLAYDGTAFTLTRLSNNTTTVLPAGVSVVDGLSIDIDATGALAGDTFLIQPTRNGARSIGQLVNDVNRLAAAAPLQSSPAVDANGNPANLGDASLSLPTNASMAGLPMSGDMQLVYDQAAAGFQVYYPGTNPTVGPPDDFIAYDNTDPADVAGVTAPSTQFTSFGEMSFTLSGIPQDGDSFIISDNTSGASDNRNALSLSALKGMDRLLGGNASYEEAYSQMVSNIGAKTHQAEVNLAAQEGLLERSKVALDEVTGVNLDEEAAKLIQFQQAYQASAQMISIAKTLFDSLLAAVSR